MEGIDKMMHVEDGGRHICLCQFPIAEWNGFLGAHGIFMDIFIIVEMRLMNS